MALIRDAIARHQLPASYEKVVNTHLRPLSRKLARWIEAQPVPPLLGINGAQGTGKSALTDFLVLLLLEEHALSSAVLSIDDLYLTRPERQALAKQVHPLLATRGVPGTHDVQLGMQTLHALRQAGPNTRTPLVRFDKARDERQPEADWPVFAGRPDVIVLEGWCVGCPPQYPAALNEPINALEAEEDRDGRWRQYVQDQLSGPYQGLFNQLDALLMLHAPDMDAVLRWRTEQEHKLAAKLGAQAQAATGLMSDEQIARFIMHYERLTRHMLINLPVQADVCFELDADHNIAKVRHHRFHPEGGRA